MIYGGGIGHKSRRSGIGISLPSPMSYRMVFELYQQSGKVYPSTQFPDGSLPAGTDGTQGAANQTAVQGSSFLNLVSNNPPPPPPPPPTPISISSVSVDSYALAGMVKSLHFTVLGSNMGNDMLVSFPNAECTNLRNFVKTANQIDFDADTVNTLVKGTKTLQLHFEQAAFVSDKSLVLNVLLREAASFGTVATSGAATLSNPVVLSVSTGSIAYDQGDWAASDTSTPSAAALQVDSVKRTVSAQCLFSCRLGVFGAQGFGSIYSSLAIGFVSLATPRAHFISNMPVGFVHAIRVSHFNTGVHYVSFFDTNGIILNNLSASLNDLIELKQKAGGCDFYLNGVLRASSVLSPINGSFLGVSRGCVVMNTGVSLATSDASLTAITIEGDWA